MKLSKFDFTRKIFDDLKCKSFLFRKFYILNFLIINRRTCPKLWKVYYIVIHKLNIKKENKNIQITCRTGKWWIKCTKVKNESSQIKKKYHKIIHKKPQADNAGLKWKYQTKTKLLKSKKEKKSRLLPQSVHAYHLHDNHAPPLTWAHLYGLYLEVLSLR